MSISSTGLSKHEMKTSPVYVRPKTACEIGGWGLTTCYRLMNKGTIRSIKINGMRLIEVASIHELRLRGSNLGAG